MSEKNSTQTAPHLTRAATAEALYDAPGSLITLLADSDTTGGALTCNTAHFEEGAAGAPAHFHTRATEFFFVTSGRLEVLLGEEILTLGKGDFLAVPPGTPHAFAPAPGTGAEVFVGFTPGMDRFDYYRLLGRVNAGEATFQDIRDSSEQYDNHYVDSVVWRERRSADA
ncbi:cupin domain-containing protein [Streptomyces sp. 12297]|uniref:cupin domain-containing protein n=1 Tax=Streptomyces sp. NBC_00239 TaxID=2903640 RepID=UPI002E299201|nr:cupin domain-containing protein [Streptomyces sp. NBC_00239]